MQQEQEREWEEQLQEQNDLGQQMGCPGFLS